MSTMSIVPRNTYGGSVALEPRPRMSLPQIADACAAMDRANLESLQALILADALATDYQKNRRLYEEAVRNRVLAAQQVQTEIDRGRADEARYRRRLHELEIERLEMNLEADRNPHHAKHIYVARAARLTDGLENAKEELDLANHELRQKKKDLAAAYAVIRRHWDEADSLPEPPAAPAYEQRLQAPRPFGGRPR